MAEPLGLDAAAGYAPTLSQCRHVLADLPSGKRRQDNVQRQAPTVDQWYQQHQNR